MSIPCDASDQDDHLNRVIAAYLEATERGNPPDRGALLADHPDLDEPLREYFSALDEVNTLVADLTPLPPSRERSPRRFGAYEVLAEIGRGGMGVVYCARQRVPDRMVALKMIRPGLWVTAADVRRFRTEGESAARLDHPNIVPIYEIGECDGQLFFSMKYCAGGHLAARATDGRPADLRRVAELVAIIARAVHHAHQRGILHRDLKPSNILLDEAGHPYVADFGLAKVLDAEVDLTATGVVLGTPGYLAPEMVPAVASGSKGRSLSPTTAVDVYGLGAILYFVLTGRPPFRGATLAETLAMVQAQEPASPRSFNTIVDRDLAAVCQRCLEKDPSGRYSSAESLAEDLGRWLAGKPTRARPVGWLPRAARWLRRNPVSTGLAALVVLSAGGGLGALAMSYRAVVAEREASRNSQRETAEYAEHLRTRVYAGDIRLAHALWQRGETAACRATLDRYRPQEGEIDLRGWEWHYINSLVRSSPLEAARFPSTTGKSDPADRRVPRGIAYHAAFSPDGRLVASAWMGGWIHLWEPWTGVVHEPIPAHLLDANWVAFIGDGTQLASASEDGTIKVWDVRTRKQIGETMKDQTGAVESIAVTPDGKRLISGGVDGILRVWDLSARKLLHELPGHTQNIEGVAVSPDGRLTASAAFDGNVQVWDLSGPEPRLKWVVNAENSLYAVAFAPDGSRVAVVRGDSSVVEFDAESGRRLGRNSNEVGRYRGVTYVPGIDGMLLAVGDDGRMRAWDASRDEFLWGTTAHPKTVWSVACSPDGRFAVTAGSDTTVRVWSLQPSPARSLDSSRGSVSYVFPDASGVLLQTTTDAVGPAGEAPGPSGWMGMATRSPPIAPFGPPRPSHPTSGLLPTRAGDGTIVLRDRMTNADRRLAPPPTPAPKWGWPTGATVLRLQLPARQ